MEKAIREAADAITESGEIKEEELSRLTKCAVAISRYSMVAYTGELRKKALDIAIAIVDYEDELKGVSEKVEGSR